MQIVYSAGTAIFSSLLTLGLVYWLWSRRLRPRLEQRMEAALAEFGETLRQQVQQGVLDGLKSISAKQVMSGTRDVLTRTAEGLVKGGLVSLLGGADNDEGP